MIPSADTIQKFTIVGSGTLGARIGLRAALSEYEVILYDINKDSFQRAKRDFQRIKKMMVRHGQIDEARFDELCGSIQYTTDLNEACKHTDFVSESVIEDVALKKKVWSEIAPLVKDSTILTTNTSYLLPSWFALESGAKERFCAFHFHDVFTARVVDIMPHENTDPSLIPVLEQVGRRLHQIPVIIKKEVQGYLFNQMFSSILMTAGKMWANDIASVEDIDRSWMGNYGMRIGPFGMIDEVGVDTLYHVAVAVNQDNDPAFMKKIKKMMDNSLLGVKSGEGFYQYPNPSYKNNDFLS